MDVGWLRRLFVWREHDRDLRQSARQQEDFDRRRAEVAQRERLLKWRLQLVRGNRKSDEP